MIIYDANVDENSKHFFFFKIVWGPLGYGIITGVQENI
jgi:hypothetical protein